MKTVVKENKEIREITIHGFRHTHCSLLFEAGATLKEVQAYLGVGRETILQWIAKRNMPAYKVGKLWKFKLSEVDDWIRSGGAADDKVDEKEDKAE